MLSTNEFQQKIREGLCLLDGATGSNLRLAGMPRNVSTELWVLENPEVIVRVQREYVEKGSRVIYTPTFGANRVKLESHGLLGKVREVNLRLAALSKQAAEGRAWVAGDIAPTGLFLYPLGETSFEELVDIYTEQAAALEEAGVLKQVKDGIKVLGQGNLKVALTVKADKFSKTAVEKIEAAGGKAEVI